MHLALQHDHKKTDEDTKVHLPGSASSASARNQPRQAHAALCPSRPFLVLRVCKTREMARRSKTNTHRGHKHSSQCFHSRAAPKERRDALSRAIAVSFFPQPAEASAWIPASVTPSCRSAGSPVKEGGEKRKTDLPFQPHIAKKRPKNT